MQLCQFMKSDPLTSPCSVFLSLLHKGSKECRLKSSSLAVVHSATSLTSLSVTPRSLTDFSNSPTYSYQKQASYPNMFLITLQYSHTQCYYIKIFFICHSPLPCTTWGCNTLQNNHRCWLLNCVLITSWMVPLLCSPEDKAS